MSYIILDRDGVINYDSDVYIKSPDEWHPIPGSLEAIAKLNQHGFKILIVTNQSGIARGFYDVQILNSIHERLIQELAKVDGHIEDILFCPHHPDEGCLCRKPKPGLIYQLQKKYAFDLSKTFFIGDSYSDIKAAQNAGCLPLLVLTGNGKNTLAQYPEFKIIPNFANLSLAVSHVIG